LEQSITIRLKPYLREFITHRFRPEELSSRKNVVGIIVQQYISYSKTGTYQHHQEGPDILTIPLTKGPAYDPRHGNAWISPRHQKELERVIYQLFKTTFYTYMDDRSRYIDLTKDGTIKDCLLQFCLDFGLSPDSVQYDTLKKSWYRYRKQKEQVELRQKKAEKGAPKVSLFCPLTYKTTAYEPLYTPQP